MSDISAEERIYRAALEQRGVATVFIDAAAGCGGLIACVPAHFFDGTAQAGDVAEKIAATEIALGQLREAIGPSLVDLAKAEQLSALAHSLD